MRYVARTENSELFIMAIPDGASVAVGAGATLYADWDAVLVDHPDAEEPDNE